MTEGERKSGGGRNGRGPGWIGTIVIALAAAAGSLVVYDARFAQKIRCVDPGPYIKAQWALVEERRITKEEFERRLDRLEDVLDRQPANTVVVLKSVVVRNGREIGL